MPRRFGVHVSGLWDRLSPDGPVPSRPALRLDQFAGCNEDFHFPTQVLLTPMKLPILLLSAAGFTALTTEFMIVGILPEIARDLDVSISVAGHLVLLFAVTVAVFGPVLTATLARFNRRRLFVAIMLVFAASNALAALSANYWVLAVARVIPALALPVFWALASATAVDLSGRNQAGRAMAIVTFGVVAASVFGVPMGVIVSEALGWRAAFAILAALASVKAIMLLTLPKSTGPQPRMSVRSQAMILRDPLVLWNIVLSVLVFASMFTAYTYLADMLQQSVGLDGAQVGWAMMTFGVVGLVGNWLGGRSVDISALGSNAVFALLLAGALCLMGAAQGAPHLSLAALCVWGIAQSALIVICQVRMMGTAPAAPAFAASLAITGANVGIGVGSGIGGATIDLAGLDYVAWAAAGVALLAGAFAGLLLVVFPVRRGLPADTP